MLSAKFRRLIDCCTRKLGISLICLACSSAAFPLEGEAKARNKPVVTIAAVVDRDGWLNAHDVQWHGSDQLAVTVSEPGSRKRVTRLLSRSGVLGKTIGEGQLASSSPDGATALIKRSAGWVLKDIQLGTAHRLPEPSADRREFVPHQRPVWSVDSRYVAFVEHYRPPPSSGPGIVTSIDGVRVIDVDRGAPAADQWSARVTIVDRLTPDRVSRTAVNDIVAGVRWDTENSLFVTTTNFFGTDATTAVIRLKPGVDDPQRIYRSSGRFQQAPPAVHPTRRLIALVLDVDNRRWSDFESILLVDAETGQEARRLTHDIPVLGGDYMWSNQGDEIFARVRNGGYDDIYAFPLKGTPRPLAHGNRRHFNMALSPDGRSLSYQTEDGYGRKDIRVLNLGTGDEQTVYVLDDPRTDFRLGEWRRIRWRSSDGIEPFGFLILPPDFGSGKKYPMIVDIHGGGPGSRLSLDGPLTLGVARGPLERHVWAALGYIVFVPDYRSTGMYGPTAIRARYGAGEVAAIHDLEDVISGTCHLIRQGYVDPDRIAVFGHSAGGQRAYILLTRSNLYRSAVLNEPTPPDPISNFIAFASGRYTGSYPEGILRDRYGGDLSEVPDRYKANYMLDSYRNTTPTLIMVGNEGLGGMNHMPAEVLYSILRQRGVPTRMLKFVDEGHTFSRPESAKVAFQEARQWLQAHIFGAAGQRHDGESYNRPTTSRTTCNSLSGIEPSE